MYQEEVSLGLMSISIITVFISINVFEPRRKHRRHRTSIVETSCTSLINTPTGGGDGGTPCNTDPTDSRRNFIAPASSLILQQGRHLGGIILRRRRIVMDDRSKLGCVQWILFNRYFTAIGRLNISWRFDGNQRLQSYRVNKQGCPSTRPLACI